MEADMLDQFQTAAEGVGAVVKRFVSATEAAAYVRELAGDGPVSSSFLPPELVAALSGIAFDDNNEPAAARLCVSNALAGVAATGSLLLELGDPAGRAATALPLIHAVFVRASTIVPDLYAVGEQLAARLAAPGAAYLSITTGPSRTADIERVLTIGVHGPKELHILVLEGA
jgi:L-lactate dehydrogenase complex protein LldG